MVIAPPKQKAEHTKVHLEQNKLFLLIKTVYV